MCSGSDENQCKENSVQGNPKDDVIGLTSDGEIRLAPVSLWAGKIPSQHWDCLWALAFYGVTVTQLTTLQQEHEFMEHYDKKWGRNTPSPFLLLFSPRTQHSFSDSPKFSLLFSPNGGFSLEGNLMALCLCKCLERPSRNCSYQTSKAMPKHVARAVAQDHLTRH